MKIKSKLNNQIQHVRRDIGAALIAAGAAEEINDGTVEAPGINGTDTYRLPQLADAVIPEPQWSVELLGGTRDRQVLAIVMRIGQHENSFTLPPKFINAKKTWPGGGRYLFFGRAVPDDIAKQYTREWKANEYLRGVYVEPEPDVENQRMTEALKQRAYEDDVRLARMKAGLP